MCMNIYRERHIVDLHGIRSLLAALAPSNIYICDIYNICNIYVCIYMYTYMCMSIHIERPIVDLHGIRSFKLLFAALAPGHIYIEYM